jgi:hypothetical protein
MEQELGRFIHKEFDARVLKPNLSQLRVESITRSTVEFYLQELQGELEVVQVEYKILQQQWDELLVGLSVTISGLEANRGVPVVAKAMTVAGGTAVVGAGSALTGRVKTLMVRRVHRELCEGGVKLGGKMLGKGLGWWIAGACVAWDVYDHHETVRKNKPVLERSMGVYLDELEELVLQEQRTGILTVLAGVQRDIMKEVSHE